MKPINGFQIEDIDGCEFVKSRIVGHIMISWHRDFDGYETGKVHVVYSDASHTAIEPEVAQEKIDNGEWTILR